MFCYQKIKEKIKEKIPFISKEKASAKQIEFFNKGFKSGNEEGREQILLAMMQNIFSMTLVDKLIIRSGELYNDVGGIVLVSPGGSPVAFKKFYKSRIIEAGDKINIKF